MEKRQGGNQALDADEPSSGQQLDQMGVETGPVSDFRPARRPQQELDLDGRQPSGRTSEGEGPRGGSHVAVVHPQERPTVAPEEFHVPAEAYGPVHDSLGPDLTQSLRDSRSSGVAFQAQNRPTVTYDGPPSDMFERQTQPAVAAAAPEIVEGELPPARPSERPTPPMPFVPVTPSQEQQVLEEKWWHRGERASSPAVRDTRPSPMGRASAVPGPLPASSPAGAGGASAAAMAFESFFAGDGPSSHWSVRDGALVRLLFLAGCDEMTVTVTISGGEGQRRLAIVEGRLVVGGCSDDDAALVRHFCKTNGGPQLSESLLLRLVAHQRRPLPWALVDAGLLEEGQLAEHVHSFVVESLLDGMCWSDASFTVARPARQGVAGRYSFPVLSLVWPALRQRMGPGETLEWFFFHSSYCLNIVGVPQVELGQLQLPPVAEFVLCHMPREPVPLEKLVNACGRGGSTARHEAMLACHLATELRWMKLVTPH